MSSPTSELHERVRGLVSKLQLEPITVKIPANHPVAARLKKLFDFYATSTKTTDGLIIQHRSEDAVAFNLVLKELRQVVMESGGDTSSIDEFHKTPDPFNFLLGNLGSLVGTA